MANGSPVTYVIALVFRRALLSAHVSSPAGEPMSLIWSSNAREGVLGHWCVPLWKCAVLVDHGPQSFVVTGPKVPSDGAVSVLLRRRGVRF